MELWIGLAEFKPLPECEVLSGYAGTITNIITWASNAVEFHEKVEELAAYLLLETIGVKDAEPLATREENHSLSEELYDLVVEAKENPDAILYATFHSYRYPELPH